MRHHVFTKAPVFCIGMRPMLILVKCQCGRVHKEYLGPRNLDINKTQIKFLEKQLTLAFRAMRPKRINRK